MKNLNKQKEKIHQYLREQPLFRERKNKDRGMVNLLIRDYPELKDVDKDKLVQAVKDYNVMDRAWRKVLEEYPALRGTDYYEKVELESDARNQLGYQNNEQRDI